jgi:peroxiredoxin
MALTPSNPFELGTKAPDFTLLNTVTNQFESLTDLKGGKGTVVLFICNHCPFVLHINEALVKIANSYQTKGINFIAISSNDVENYPQDSSDKMREVALQLQYPFSYLYDETQEVAKSYDAACTPDIYVFDSNLKATYHGQLDHSRPGNGLPVTGLDLIEAMDAVLNNTKLTSSQKPSIGCNIKWKTK